MCASARVCVGDVLLYTHFCPLEKLTRGRNLINEWFYRLPGWYLSGFPRIRLKKFYNEIKETRVKHMKCRAYTLNFCFLFLCTN